MSHNPNNPPIDSQFELAANPLNSLNPPPRDLPILLDNLIYNDGLLEQEIDRLFKLGRELDSRLTDLQSRLENLRRKFPQWRRDNPYTAPGPKDKHRLAFEGQEVTYAQMITQVSLMHNVAQIRLPFQLIGERKKCKDVFDEFLGSHHRHLGIEIANSAHLHCVNGCQWYFEIGPYEWSKKPYSNEWWAGINQTDWDWEKVRKHIENIIEAVPNKYLRAAHEFQDHLQTFVPPWFWKGDMLRWGLQTRFRIIENRKGVKQLHRDIFVSYEKDEAELEQEHAQIVAALIRQREQRGEENPADVDLKSIVIDPMGDFEISINTVFDGQRLVADWEKAQGVTAGSWLDYWKSYKWSGGYQRPDRDVAK